MVTSGSSPLTFYVETNMENEQVLAAVLPMIQANLDRLFAIAEKGMEMEMNFHLQASKGLDPEYAKIQLAHIQAQKEQAMGFFNMVTEVAKVAGTTFADVAKARASQPRVEASYSARDERVVSELQDVNNGLRDINDNLKDANLTLSYLRHLGNISHKIDDFGALVNKANEVMAEEKINGVHANSVW